MPAECFGLKNILILALQILAYLLMHNEKGGPQVWTPHIHHMYLGHGARRQAYRIHFYYSEAGLAMSPKLVYDLSGPSSICQVAGITHPGHHIQQNIFLLALCTKPCFRV